jgi:uncharacterized protein YrrD
MNIEIEIPVNATVECTDGVYGTSTHVILNPHTRRVTHLVAKEKAFPHADHLVPATLIQESTPRFVRLRATRQELTALPPFTEMEFVSPDRYPDEYAAGYPPRSVLFWPDSYRADAEPPAFAIEHELTPAGEVAVARGTSVEATHGPVGRVDDFVFDPATERITHLVLRTGHLWGRRDVAIPVEAIERIDELAVRLKLDKHAIGALPAVPARLR